MATQNWNGTYVSQIQFIYSQSVAANYSHVKYRLIT